MKANELRINNWVEWNGYKVSDKGVILSKKNRKPIKYRKNDKGYPCASLWINGKSKFIRIHRLLAQLFIPNPENKPCVNHIDRDRANFDIKNLEWVTHSENVIHSINNGGRDNWTRNNVGINNPNTKLSWSTVCAIRELYSGGNYSQNELSKIFNLSQGYIAKIVNNKVWMKKN